MVVLRGLGVERAGRRRSRHKGVVAEEVEVEVEELVGVVKITTTTTTMTTMARASLKNDQLSAPEMDETTWTLAGRPVCLVYTIMISSSPDIVPLTPY